VEAVCLVFKIDLLRDWVEQGDRRASNTGRRDLRRRCGCKLTKGMWRRTE
jgi:hypothetical protein